MTETVNLDSKDMRAILAKFFGVDEKQISLTGIPLASAA